MKKVEIPDPTIEVIQADATLSMFKDKMTFKTEDENICVCAQTKIERIDKYATIDIVIMVFKRRDYGGDDGWSWNACDEIHLSNVTTGTATPADVLYVVAVSAYNYKTVLINIPVVLTPWIDGARERFRKWAAQTHENILSESSRTLEERITGAKLDHIRTVEAVAKSRERYADGLFWKLL
jgi:hypothetical protein